MAAITQPRQARVFPSRRIIAVVGSVLILAIVALVLMKLRNNSSLSTLPTSTVSRGAITASVAGIGTIAAAQSVDLAVPGTGTVSAVLVQAGDSVAVGQTVRRLVDRALQSQV